MATDTKATVATPSADYEEMERKRWLCRVLMVGTGEHGAGDGSFLDKADDLLPQYGSEHEADYRFRRDHLTVVPPDFPDSVDAVVSAILNGEIGLEGAPLELWDPETRAGHWMDIDRQGRSGDAFIAAAGSESIADGLSAVVVDHYMSEDGEDARPYWTQIHDADLLETKFEGGVLVRARWSEWAMLYSEEAPWEEKYVERIKVVYRGDPKASLASQERYARFETYVKAKDPRGGGESWQKLENGDERWPGENLEGFLSPPRSLRDDLAAEFVEIPLYLVPSGYRRPGVSWPPLRHQAQLIRLWSLMHSDYASAQHYAMNPRDVIQGVDEATFAEHNPGDTPAGQGNLTFLPSNAEWRIVNHDGSSFGSVAAFLDTLAEKIRAAGIETLRSPASGVELATLGLLERERKLTRLEVISMFWAGALQRCIRRTELLMGLEPVTVVMLPEPNQDLLVAPQAKQMFLNQAAANEMIDPETYWEIGREIVGRPDLDPEEIVRKLAEYKNSLTGGFI